MRLIIGGCILVRIVVWLVGVFVVILVIVARIAVIFIHMGVRRAILRRIGKFNVRDIARLYGVFIFAGIIAQIYAVIVVFRRSGGSGVEGFVKIHIVVCILLVRTAAAAARAHLALHAARELQEGSKGIIARGRAALRSGVFPLLGFDFLLKGTIRFGRCLRARFLYRLRLHGLYVFYILGGRFRLRLDPRTDGRAAAGLVFLVPAAKLVIIHLRDVILVSAHSVTASPLHSTCRV